MIEPKDRLEIYRMMLLYFKRGWQTDYGICVTIYNVIKLHFPQFYLAENLNINPNFPELLLQKPHKTDPLSYWWPKENVAARIHALESAIIILLSEHPELRTHQTAKAV